jgi:hypothetical protein
MRINDNDNTSSLKPDLNLVQHACICLRLPPKFIHGIWLLCTIDAVDLQLCRTHTKDCNFARPTQLRTASC